MYTAVYGTCTRPCTWHVTAVYTAHGRNYLNIYVVQTESDADEYLSVMREKNNLVCHYFYRFAVYTAVHGRDGPHTAVA